MTSSAAATERVAAELASQLRAGDVVLVSGEMGAGKTTFVRGACRALGIGGPVTSPTFVLARRYDDGRLPVAHLDLHRLADLDGEDAGLLADHLGPEGVAFVEWPAAGGAALARAATWEVRLSHAGEDARAIEVRRTG